MIQETSVQALLENPALRLNSADHYLPANTSRLGATVGDLIGSLGLNFTMDGDGERSTASAAGKPSHKNLSPLELSAGLHEWFSIPPSVSFSSSPAFSSPLAAPVSHQRFWFPAITLLAAVAGKRTRGTILFVGRSCWPTADVLEKTIAQDPDAPAGESGDGKNWQSRCVFVDPPTDAERLMVIDHALRCPNVAAVVALGQGLDARATLRLQQAAEAGGAVALLARPLAELAESSAALTRWAVQPELTQSFEPRWNVELLRRKGLPVEPANRWIVEWHHDAADTHHAFYLASPLISPLTAPTAPSKTHAAPPARKIA